MLEVVLAGVTIVNKEEIKGVGVKLAVNQRTQTP